MTLQEMVAESATGLQLAEALYASELKPSPSELLSALKATHAHPFASYLETWSMRHAQEVLETVDYLREVRGAYEDS